MELNLGEKIKSLRKAHGLTQERLAEILDVTFQAVSKWETGAAMPDITMLLAIARFFEVSTDELLGVDIMKTQEEITAVCAQAQALFVPPFDREKYRQAVELLRRAAARYPGNEQLLYCLSWALRGNPDSHDEAIVLLQRLLKTAADPDLRLRILRDLVYANGETPLALSYAEQLPPFRCCREFTIGRGNMLRGRALADYLLSNIDLFVSAVLECLEYFVNEKILTPEEKLPLTAESARERMDVLRRVVMVDPAREFDPRKAAEWMA